MNNALKFIRVGICGESWNTANLHADSRIVALFCCGKPHITRNIKFKEAKTIKTPDGICYPAGIILSLSLEYPITSMSERNSVTSRTFFLRKVS